MTNCHIYFDDKMRECCEHTNKLLIDAEPKNLRGLIYYGDGDKCPHCRNSIIIIPY